MAGVELYSPNHKTGYHNGNLFRLDVLMFQHLGNGWGAGLVGGWINQLESDQSSLSELRGREHRGRATGLGPIISYEMQQGDTQISFSMRWVYEFNVYDRPKGNALQLSVTAIF